MTMDNFELKLKKLRLRQPSHELDERVLAAKPEPTFTDEDRDDRQVSLGVVDQTQAASESLEHAIVRNRISRWMGKLGMRQRIAFSGVAITILLAFFLVWQGFATKPLSAMEKMAESIRKAKSYKETHTTQYVVREDPNKPLVIRKSSLNSVMYWLAPDSYRQDSTYSDGRGSKGRTPWNGPGPEIISIFFMDKPGIHINNKAKTFAYNKLNPKLKINIMKPEDWGNLSVKADRDLGTKELNGKKAIGFEIDIKQINPEFPEPGIMEIWIDAESSLPIHTCLTTDSKADGSKYQQLSNYEWNIDLDPKLFDTTPPEGYTDTTPKPPTLEEQILHITEAFKIYSDASLGYYPRIHTFSYGRPLDLRYLLINKVIKIPTDTTEQERSDYIKESLKKIEHSVYTKEIQEPYSKAVEGFHFCYLLQTANSDFAYYGQTVTPKDKEKVLLRWKLDNGQYEVIFGDLRAETISAERLRALEGK